MGYPSYKIRRILRHLRIFILHLRYTERWGDARPMRLAFALYIAHIMKTRLLSIITFSLVFCASTWADIDISELYLQNYGFDDSEHFDYKANEQGNVAQEILPVYGWSKDIGVDYTVTGVYELGTGKTFNTNGKVPSSGYQGSKGGCLVLSTGWEESLKYYQKITLPAGSYKLQAAFYNGSNSTNGYSLLGWIPDNGSSSLSRLSSFPMNWTLDEVTFTLSLEKEGKVQIGFKGVANGSANSAKVVVDFVRLYLVGDNGTLIAGMRSTLRTTLSTASTTYGSGTGNGAADLKAVMDEVQRVCDDESASYADLFRADEALKAQLEVYGWANSSSDHPSDMTRFIVNPSFEDGFEGWIVSGLQTQSNTSFSLKSGNYYVEKWVSAGSKVGSASVVQEIGSEAPNGVYTLKVSAQNTQDGRSGQTGAWIIAGSDSVAVSEKKEYTLQFTHMEESFSIGFVAKNASGNWLSVDNFRLLYSAASMDDYTAEIQRRVEVAENLLSGTIYKAYRTQLESEVSKAKEWLGSPNEKDLSSIATRLRQYTELAASSAAAFQRLADEVALAENTYEEGKNGSAELLAAINEAKKYLGNESMGVDDLDGCVKRLDDAIFTFQVANATGDVPTVVTDPRHATGATMAFGRATFSGNNITERGFCWSTSSNPTVLDERSSLSYSNNGTIYVMTGLTPSTVYYIRPYAITRSNAVGYGERIKICTLPKGDITWSYNNGGSDEENKRINEAVADACDVWNNITSIRGLHLTVSYGASTQTADCSYGGWMRVGPNASYQRTGTIQHEMCHAAGVGTTDNWMNSSVYRQETTKGFWLGERTDQILHFLENDNSAQLKGDNTHFWPYGINGAHEDDGTRILYYANALIIQALGEDNLPPVSGAFASPAYTFTQEDYETYYLLSAGQNVSTPTSLRVENGNLSVKATDWQTMLKENAYAWKIHFEPETQLYDFRNVSEDKSLSCANSRLSLGSQEKYAVQLMGSRQNVTNQYFNLKSYWMVFADGTNRPMALSSANNSVSAARFDHQNSASQQRWIILSKAEVKALAGDLTAMDELRNETTSLLVYNVEEGFCFETVGKAQWVTVYDMRGLLVDQFYMQAGMRVVKPIQSGVYVVNGQKIIR